MLELNKEMSWAAKNQSLMETLQQTQLQHVSTGRRRRRVFTHRIHFKRVSCTSWKQFSVLAHSGGTPGDGMHMCLA